MLRARHLGQILLGLLMLAAAQADPDQNGRTREGGGRSRQQRSYRVGAVFV